MRITTTQAPPKDYYVEEYAHHRVINLTVDRSSSDVCLGFNIRGGSEFGLGIFVSGVEEGSIADKAGFKVGDEIIDINGMPFDGITHAEAVELITSTESICATVTSTGRVPDEEQRLGKHAWINNNGERINDRNHHSDHDFSTEDLYVSDHDSEHSFPVYNDACNLHLPMNYAQQTPRYPIDVSMAQQQQQHNVKTNGASNKVPPPSSHKSKKKTTKKPPKKSAKGKGAKSKGGAKSELEEINLERNQLVDMVCDKLQLDFSVNDCGMIRQAINLYHGGEAVDDLLNHILLLFPPRKYELLREVRKIVYSDEIPRYDDIVSRHLQRMIEKSNRKETQALVNKGYDPKPPTPPAPQPVQPPAQPPVKQPPAQPTPPAPAPPPPAPLVAPVVAAAPTPVKEVDNSVVFTPVKSSYKSKDSSKRVKHVRNTINIINEPSPSPQVIPPPQPQPTPEPSPPAEPAPTPEPVTITTNQPKPEEVLVLKPASSGPVIKEYTPFNPEPFVLYDKDRNPVQKLAHGVRVTPQTSEIVPVAMDTIDGAPTAHAQTKVVKVETTEVRKRSRKESIEITKKGAKDNTIVSVRKTSTDSDRRGKLLVIKNSDFDEASNTITINATLNVGTPVNSPAATKKAVGSGVFVTAEVARTPVISPPEVVAAAEVVVAPAEVVAPAVVAVPKVTATSSEMTAATVVKTTTTEVSRTTATENVAVASISGTFVQLHKHRVYEINKTHRLIGLSISGGSDSRYQREIRIVAISADSAAFLSGLQVGQTLLAIDEHSLINKTHGEACHLIRSTFRDKANNIMKITVETSE